MYKIIFLDIDGCLNMHSPYENGYNGIEKRCVANLNYILREVPDVHIIISSAWRYMMLQGEMTVLGFEYLLLTHGVNCKNRLRGYTEADEEIPANAKFSQINEWGLDQRERQIKNYIKKYDITKYVIVDDLPLQLGNFVKTEPTFGLSHQLAQKVVEILKC